MKQNHSEVSAFIAIDKPAGISSFGVISRLRKLTGIRKIGHCGTLDPFATGLLVCCIGSYTRLARFVEAEDKSYLATIQLGKRSSTGDPEGCITETAEIPYSIPNPRQIVDNALLLQELPVPAYSAIKVEGKRAYSLARAGIELAMPKRQTRISLFTFINREDGSLINSLGELSYRCTVSKGTYIRSLSEWLAKQMDTVAYTIQLRRESIGNISINQAVAIGELTNENWQDYLLSTKFVLENLIPRELDESQVKQVLNGGDIELLESLDGAPQADMLVSERPTYSLYDYTGRLIAIGEEQNMLIHPIIVLK